jgi:vacuolar-type H+-ATPase subunit F/Vma7
MAKKLENIFNDCLERMIQGESIESCIRSYPEEVAELEPLLRAALDIKERALPVQLCPEFENQTRIRLEGAQLYAKQQKQLKRAWSSHWKRGWAYALTVVIVILFVSGGTIAASSSALPDNPLYSVKLASEQVRLVFTFSDAGKAELHTQLAEKRVQEIVAMAHQGNTEQVTILTTKLASYLEEANYSIKRVEEIEAKQFIELPKKAPTESMQLKEFAKESVSYNIAILEKALENTPEQTKPALQQAINISRDLNERLQLEIDIKTKPSFVQPK